MDTCRITRWILSRAMLSVDDEEGLQSRHIGYSTGEVVSINNIQVFMRELRHWHASPYLDLAISNAPMTVRYLVVDCVNACVKAGNVQP